MVWAAFCGRERSNLYRIVRDISSRRQGYSVTSYIEGLEENIPQIWEPRLLFMQDNAPIYTARAVRK